MFLDAIGNAANIGGSAADGARIADNFDTFLTLLTTQLKNQNPLDPLDTNQFTQQLVEFSGVEQAIRTNKNLEMLVQVSAANAATAATGFIGKRVTVESTTTSLASGSAQWSYKSSAEAVGAKFTIRDADGQVVWEGERNIDPGRETFTWNGRNMDGDALPDGPYTLTIEAKDADGEIVDVGIEVSAKIDAVDFSGQEPVLLVGDKGIPLSQVKSVSSS